MSTKKEEINQCIPPNTFQRNEFGLLTNINYKFNNDGFIDWIKMIPQEYLVPNLEKTKETDVTKLKEDELIILLGGLKKLANLRGYSDVTYNVVSASDQYAAVICKIKWLPNYETLNKEITFESIAGVHLYNVKSFARYYLVEMAENRAFARCVRNFLKINIVSDKEIGEIGSSNVEQSSPEDGELKIRAQVIEKIESFMKKNNIMFSELKQKLIDTSIEGADKYESFNDIKTPILCDLLAQISKKKRNKSNPIPE